MLPSFAHQHVTVLNPGRTDEWGHEVDDWTNPETVDVTCVWESSATTLMGTLGGFDVAAASRNVYMPPGTPVTGHSRLRFPDDPGRDWEVIGEPAYNESPTGAVSNVTVIVRRWEAKQ